MTDIATFKAAVWYPWDDGDAGLTLVIGGILTLLSPLLVPGFVVLGYGLRVVESILDGEEHPPSFAEWRSMLVDGIKGFIVLLVYVVLPLVVVGAVALAVGSAAGFTPRPGRVGFSAGFGLGVLTFVVLFLLAGLALVVSYLAPAALVHLARSRRLGSAFAFGEVRRLVGAPPFGAAWLLALALFAAAGVVLWVLNAAAIGVIVSGFVTFYAFVGMAYLYAHGAKTAGVELASATDATGAAVAVEETVDEE